MKTSFFIPTTLSVLLLAGCAHTGSGGPGVSEVETGTDRAVEARDNAVGPFQEPGFPDAAVAANRAQDSLAPPSSGPADLPQPEATATAAGPTPRLDVPPPVNSDLAADRIVLQRIQLALSSADPKEFTILEPFSIQTLNNVRITVNRGVVTLRGPVNSLENKKNIEARVRAVPGVESVRNELQIVPTPGQLGAPVGVPGE